MFRKAGLPATFFIIGSRVGDPNGIRNKVERNTPVTSGEKNSDGSPMTAPSVAASAVKTTGGAIVLKVVNPTTCAQSVRLNLKGRAKHVIFTGSEADACNSLYDRESLKEVTRNVVLDGVVELPPLSLSVYALAGQSGGK